MVEIKNVSFRYYARGAAHPDMADNCLSGINLTVQGGEFVLLTGPSGCGKTTILRLINGLIPHFYPGEVEGSILVSGKEIRGMELYETANLVGTVFQNPRTQFYNVDTSGELAFGCENRGLPKEQIYERIDRTVSSFGIEKLMDRSIFHLSDGEKQKIACASVDVSGPDLILLDEPSANLDFQATMALRDLIGTWRSQGKTIIAAEHRIAYLWDLINRAIILDNGQILRQLTRDELSSLSPEDLSRMGLRTNIMEAPEELARMSNGANGREAPEDRARVGTSANGREAPKTNRLLDFEEHDEPLILRDFYFSYRGRKEPILHIPQLRLAAHEITAVTGSNGLGKTTFLNCLCGLEKKCSGTLEYKGRRLGRKERQKLCYLVMQDTGNQLFTESVLEEVLISLPPNTKNEKEKAIQLLEQLDLGEYLDRHPQSLSGGQKQRLAIACALASGREILLLDEPTSGLDYRHMKETAALLKKLQEMGTTILVVTHDAELIHSCCSRMITKRNICQVS